MIKIIIADDHAIFTEGLSIMLSTASDIVVLGKATEGNGALKLIDTLHPDVAILDISMPGMNGIEIAKEVYRKRLNTKIILLTMHNNPFTAGKLLRSGVSGYVMKEDAFKDLMHAIKTVRSGGQFVSPSLAEKMSCLRNSKAEGFAGLSGREKEVLQLISSGLTNKQIAARLLISVKTVESHRTNIMQKLCIHNTAELVRYAIKEGLA